MRWPLLIAVMTLAASASAHAQTRTRCTSADGLTIDCRTNAAASDPVPIADYAAGLKAAGSLVPAFDDNRLANEQIEALRLSNQLKRRDLERQDAPGYDRKQCRKSAAAALSANDLTLARDVLNACAGGR